jgi:hypothetical protein
MGGGALAWEDAGMSETPTTPPLPAPYAQPGDVHTALGKLGNRPGLPDVDKHLAMAHAEVLDLLGDVYGATIPDPFRPIAAEALRWAEAKLAAAAILDILRAAYPDESAVAAQLRESALATIRGGLPGQRPGDTSGSVTPPPGSGPVTLVPRLATEPPVSNFADPYAELYAVPRFPDGTFYL